MFSSKLKAEKKLKNKKLTQNEIYKFGQWKHFSERVQTQISVDCFF